MTTLLVTLAFSFLLGIVLTPLARAIACRCGLVDEPDGRRKMHARPIPLSGGIAVFAAATLALAAIGRFSPWLGEGLRQEQGGLTGLMLAALVICGFGLADELRLIRGWHKLIGQVLAVGIVIGSGVVVQRLRLFDWQVELGLL